VNDFRCICGSACSDDRSAKYNYAAIDRSVSSDVSSSSKILSLLHVADKFAAYGCWWKPSHKLCSCCKLSVTAMCTGLVIGKDDPYGLRTRSAGYGSCIVYCERSRVYLTVLCSAIHLKQHCTFYINGRGVARNLFVSEGTKEWDPLPLTSEVQSPGWILGQSLQKPENYVENLIECQKFHTVQGKKFSVTISEGDMSLVPPSLRPWLTVLHNGSARVAVDPWAF